MRIAMIGTRGIPARYGGFETAVEEIGRRLADAGHEVVVYCRGGDESDPATYLGMERVVLPALRTKSLETLSHTMLSAFESWRRPRFDAVFLFNAANAPFLPVIRRRRTPIAVHVDGLESQRGKWGAVGRRYYRTMEALSVRWADALIADAAAIGRYYHDEFGAATEVIAYGAPIIESASADGLDAFDVEPGRYHLVVARFEPENHVELIVEGYERSDARWPLVVVGGAPYAEGYVGDVHDAARGDERIRFVGPVWDQDLLDRLYHHAGTYVHGHSVGGTNPSLLRAMGAGAAVLAYDAVFNREVLGETGAFFHDEVSVADELVAAECEPDRLARRGDAGRHRASTQYRWDDVADAYGRLAERLRAGFSRRGEVSGRRCPDSAWNVGEPTMDHSVDRSAGE